MNSILKDHTKFKQLLKDSNMLDMDKFQRFLYNLKRRKFRSDDIYNLIRLSSAFTPTLYGLPKTHKPGTLCRPILSSYSSCTYECFSWSNEVLTPPRQYETIIRNFFNFADEASKLIVKQSDSLVFFDVRNLFNNISTEIVSKLILKKIFDDLNLNTFHGMKKPQFKKMLNWVTQTNSSSN